MKVSCLVAQPHPLFLDMSVNEPGPSGRTPEDTEDIRLMGLASTGDMAAFEALDQSVSAVKSLLFRARTELRESLKRYLSS